MTILCRAVVVRRGLAVDYEANDSAGSNGRAERGATLRRWQQWFQPLAAVNEATLRIAEKHSLVQRHTASCFGIFVAKSPACN
jgi:hypothetical protein